MVLGSAHRGGVGRQRQECRAGGRCVHSWRKERGQPCPRVTVAWSNPRTRLSALQSRAKSRVILAGVPLRPVPLEADFFGRRILSPFLLSAAPHTDGYAQMRKAYEHGWSGGVMKTAFDNVPIHIPAGYLFALTRSTYGNCDNVSGHPLDRVCREVERLVKEFPDRLTLASTGGPVTGNDDGGQGGLAIQHPQAGKRRRDGRRIQPLLPARRRRHARRCRFAKRRTDREDH